MIRTLELFLPYGYLSTFAMFAFKDNPVMPRLYMTGVFFFIMMYTGSNVIPIGK